MIKKTTNTPTTNNQQPTTILLVSANFYPEVSAELLAGARAELARVGAEFEEISVGGAFEIPAVISLALDAEKYDGFVALGCVIPGETTHYDYVCGESARAIMELNIQADACIGYGILTVENMEQAMARASISEGNKGRDAVVAALQLIEVKRRFSEI
jgi:6,7-dimethyl-8-ribityllumazine synthase